MSNTFDTVETTLKDLKDIVDRIQTQSGETSQLVQDMELLIAQIKSKARVEPRGKQESAPIAIAKPAAVVL
jgi:hypothetical protein